VLPGAGVGVGLGLGAGVGETEGDGDGEGVGPGAGPFPPQLAMRIIRHIAIVAVASPARRLPEAAPRTMKTPNAIINTAITGQVRSGDARGAAAALAVVVTVRVTFTGTLFAGVTVGGENVQMAPAGRPLQLRLVERLNPPDGITVRLYTVLCPAVTVAPSGELTREKSPAAFPTVNVVLAVLGCSVGSPAYSTETVNVP